MTLHRPSNKSDVTLADLATLPPTVDLRTAAKILGIGRTVAYELAQKDKFPCRIFRVGMVYRVPTIDLLRLLGMTPTDDKTTTAEATVIDDARPATICPPTRQIPDQPSNGADLRH